MRAAWAYQDRPELRAAIWKWLTRPAEELSGRRTAGGGKQGRIAYAFDLWIRHLTLLERVLGISQVGWRELHAAEVEGLEMLREARQRYAAEYRRCDECGAAARGKICPRCGALGDTQAAGH